MECRVLYLLGSYPRWSETFIRRDLVRLEGLGLPLVAAAVCRGDCDLQEGWPSAAYLGPDSPDGTATGTVSAGRCALTRLCPPGLRGRLSLAAHRVERRALADLIARSGATHLHAEFADLPALLVSQAARKSGLSFSIGVHARDVFTCKYDPGALFAEARFVTACNRAAYDRLVSLCPGVRERAHLIHHGLDLGDWPFQESRQAGGDCLTLLFVGRFVRKKGIPVLLRALAQLGSEAANVRLTLVGDGPERSTLEALARDLGVDGRLSWAGVVPPKEVRHLLHEADCLVVPSVVDKDGDRDGVPNVVLEAMAVGTPVVASDVGGIPEAVRPETGWLCEPNEPGNLAQAIGEALQNRELAEDKRRRARRLLEDQFDAAKLAQARFRLFADACGLSRTRCGG